MERGNEEISLWSLGGLSDASLKCAWTGAWRNHNLPGAPVPRVGGVFEHVEGIGLIFIGGRNSNNGSLKEKSFKNAYVCKERGAAWETHELNLGPGVEKERFPEIFVYHMIVGDILYLLPSMDNHFYALNLKTWTLSMLDLAPPGHMGSPEALAQVNGTVYLQCYDNTMCASLTGTEWKSVDVIKSSNIPFETHGQYWFALTDRMLIMTKESYSMGAGVYLFDTQERKWLLISPKEKAPLPFLKGGRMHFVGPFLVWINKGTWEKGPLNTSWIFNLLEPTKGWIKAGVSGDAPEHSRCYEQTSIGNEGGAIYFNGLGETEKEFLLAALTVTLDGAPIDPSWRESVQSAALAAMEAFKPPAPFVPDAFVAEEEIVIDASLSPLELKYHWKMATDVPSLFAGSGGLFDPKSIIATNIPPLDGDKSFCHKNLMHYWTMCFDAHLGVVLTPDQIFYTVLAELAHAIRSSPDRYRALFTRSSAKVELVVLSSDPAHIDFDALIAQVAKHSPADTDLFTAKFSTTTAASMLAMQAAFLEAMGAYFSYGNTCCGIPKVRVLGTLEDWQLLHSKVTSIAEFFANHKELATYLSRAALGVSYVYQRRSVDHWKDFFAISRCHSGHTDVVEGWSTFFFRNSHSSEHRGVVTHTGTDFYNYESHISQVDWKNLDTERKFSLFTGLLHSSLSPDGYLVPSFCHVVCEVPSTYDQETYARYVESLNDNDQAFLEGLKEWLLPEESQVVLDGGDECKKDWVLKALERRLEREKQQQQQQQDLTVLRELSFDYFDWFCHEFTTHGQHSEEDPRSIKFATLMRNLIALNCWRKIRFTTEVGCMDLLLSRLGDCFNVTEFECSKMTEPILKEYARLLRDPRCTMREVRFCADSSAAFPQELYDAIVVRKPDTVRFESFYTESVVAQFLDFLRSGRAPSNCEFKIGYCAHSDMIWQFLLEHPDAKVDCRMDFGRGEDLDALLLRYISTSTRLKTFEPYEMLPGLKSPSVESLRVGQCDLTLLNLKDWPKLKRLSLGCDATEAGLIVERLKDVEQLEAFSLSLGQSRSSRKIAPVPLVVASLFEELARLNIKELSLTCNDQGTLDALVSWIRSDSCTLTQLTIMEGLKVPLLPLYEVLPYTTSLVALTLTYVPSGPTADQVASYLESGSSLRKLSAAYKMRNPIRWSDQDKERITQLFHSTSVCESLSLLDLTLMRKV